jgi:hypothetical protein
MTDRTPENCSVAGFVRRATVSPASSGEQPSRRLRQESNRLAGFVRRATVSPASSGEQQSRRLRQESNSHAGFVRRATVSPASSGEQQSRRLRQESNSLVGFVRRATVSSASSGALRCGGEGSQWQCGRHGGLQVPCLHQEPHPRPATIRTAEAWAPSHSQRAFT